MFPLYVSFEGDMHSLIFHELHLPPQILGKRNLTYVQLSCPPSWTMGSPFIFSLIIGTKLTSSASSLQPYTLHCVPLSPYSFGVICAYSNLHLFFSGNFMLYPLPSIYVPSKANLLIFPLPFLGPPFSPPSWMVPDILFTSII